MWSYYADAQKGICIELDLTADEKFFEEVQPIHYQDKLPTLKFWTDTARQKAEKSCLTKASHWTYEAEWRIADWKIGTQSKPFAPEEVSAVYLGDRMADEYRERVPEWIRDRPREVSVFRARVSDSAYGLDILPEDQP